MGGKGIGRWEGTGGPSVELRGPERFIRNLVSEACFQPPAAKSIALVARICLCPQLLTDTGMAAGHRRPSKGGQMKRCAARAAAQGALGRRSGTRQA